MNQGLQNHFTLVWEKFEQQFPCNKSPINLCVLDSDATKNEIFVIFNKKNNCHLETKSNPGNVTNKFQSGLQSGGFVELPTSKRANYIAI